MEPTTETSLVPHDEEIKLLPAPQTQKSNLFRDAILFGLTIIFFTIIFSPSSDKPPREALGTADLPTTELVSDPFLDMELSARSALVYDATTGEVFFERNADEVLPLASVTKVMTAVTALSLLPEYAVIKIEKEFLRAEGDTGLFADERWLLKDLLEFTLVTSSNDGARAVASVGGALLSQRPGYDAARETFVYQMNEKARELGLVHTRFFNETGLDESSEISGGYGTARDVAKLMAYAVAEYPFLFETTGEEELTTESLSKISHTATNTNQAVNTIPMLIASKTGFTELAGGNLAVAFDRGPGRPIIVVVLGSTLEGRFEDVTTLASAAVAKITSE